MAKKIIVGLPVSNIKQLKGLIKRGVHDYYIKLELGLRSSKYIVLVAKGKVFLVCHVIDGSEAAYNEKGLMESHIGEAMKKNAFFYYVRR